MLLNPQLHVLSLTPPLTLDINFIPTTLAPNIVRLLSLNPLFTFILSLPMFSTHIFRLSFLRQLEPLHTLSCKNIQWRLVCFLPLVLNTRVETQTLLTIPGKTVSFVSYRTYPRIQRLSARFYFVTLRRNDKKYWVEGFIFFLCRRILFHS